MREVLLVLEREFNERVRTRAFVIGTVLFPVFMIALLFLPTLSGGSNERTIVVVDESPAPIGELFVAALTPADGPDGASVRRSRGATLKYRIEVVKGPLEAVQAGLVHRIEAEQIDGYVALPATLADSGAVQYRSTRIADGRMMSDLRLAAGKAVHAYRLARSGVDVQRVAELLTPVELDGGRIDARGEEAGSARSGLVFAYIVAMIIYIMIAMYGTGVTRSVLEEKNNRIAEVLVSSMHATHLMVGKILGVGAAVILQIVIWVAIIMLLITQSDLLAQQFGIDPSALNAIAAQPGTMVLLGAYFVIGFLLFAALFAALGAAVTSDQEAQSFQMLFMLPLFLPLVFLMQLTTQPLEPLSRTLGLIPFTAPIAMPMRMAVARIPVTEALISIALLIITLVLTAWLAGKIYRIGILSTGRKPSIRELVHWLRAT
jgi:ABC-2 type transport system permease protein